MASNNTSNPNNSHIMNTYGRQPVAFERGEGVFLFDKQDNKYLDAISGIAVNALGHGHPAFVKAIQEQAAKLIHTSNLYGIELQEQLANALCEATGMQHVFFSNSGAEANEAAIKIARKYGNDRGIENPTIIVTEKSFHGRTMATISATGNNKVQEGFAPLLSGFVRAPYNDISAIKSLAEKHSNIVAILVEPVQGEGGVHIPADDYLNELRAICDQQNWLLMLDEVQTGNGRTGEFFAFQHNNITPDVVATAKGLGNGLPIGACLVAGKADSILGPGNHGSTFGGNPLCCAGALSVVNTIKSEKLCDNTTSMGEYLVDQFKNQLADNQHIVNIRGKGLMIGIELDQDCPELVNQLREQGVLINVTSGSVIRLLPPLTINKSECDLLVNILCKAIHTFTNNSAVA